MTNSQKAENSLKVKSVFILQVNGDVFELSQKTFFKHFKVSRQFTLPMSFSTTIFSLNGMTISRTSYYYKQTPVNLSTSKSLHYYIYVIFLSGFNLHKRLFSLSPIVLTK